jgi:S-methylmethionine-dependent homocysteine/selenocysteine methylase
MWNKRWGIYPNLGLGEPSSDGNIQKIHSDEEFLSICKQAIKLGASIIGGCCGSSAKHISLLKNKIIRL